LRLIRKKLFAGVLLFVFLFVCAVESIFLGFQHYLTMLGTTVLIPTLVFRSILGESVGWFFLSLSISSFVLFSISFWVGSGVAAFRSINNLQRKWVYDVGFKKLLQALHHRVYMCVCVCVLLQSDLSRVVQSALFVSAINTLLQTVLGSRLPAVMGNSFYFLSITLSIVNAPSIIDIPDPHEVSKPYSPSHSLSPIISTNAQDLHPL
jgi:xanthine/uracil permease